MRKLGRPGHKPRAGARAALGLAVAASLTLAGLAAAQEVRFFRIGTGAVNSTVFPVGALIAGIISNPPGARTCETGGSCGVEGLIAVAQTTQGSIDNIAKIASGEIEAALSLANLAYWAYHGTGIFADKGAVQNMRAIANLYPALVHAVVRADSGIDGIADLRGRRVSLSAPKSGTLVETKIILAAYGVGADQIEAVYSQPGEAMDMLSAGTIDALFVVGGLPTGALEDLARTVPIRLLPIDGPEAARLREAYPFFAPASVASGTYQGVPATHTLAIGVQFVVSDDVDDETVYGIARALWHDVSRPLLDKGHPLGRAMRLETALQGVAIPLHPGAALYYFDRGMVSGDPT